MTMTGNTEDFYILAVTFMVCCASLAVILAEDAGGEEEEPDVESIARAVGILRRMRKRVFRGSSVEGEGAEDTHQRKKKKYDYERAYRCVQYDYLGIDPLFEKQFDRVFRVTRGIVEQIIQLAGNSSEFFTHRQMATGEMGIYPEVKVLMALKTLAFGCSSAAFMDYFQMGTTSARECVRQLCRIISKSPTLRDKYLRKMNRNDAKKVSKLHENEFGVPGCIGCLDCMHVYWRNCPVAWQGQYKGKDGSPSIVLEAVADYNTWIWHLSFGFPGTLNDINIWDQSTLLRSFLDGSFVNAVDFVYRVGDETFNKLFILVDGIYPELSRFVKTLSVPLTRVEKKYAEWQESKWKSIERAFGIAQRKWQVLCRPVENWYEDEIEEIVEACFILHNMMVEVRVSRDEREEVSWYEVIEATEQDNNNDTDDNSFIGRHEIDIEDHDFIPPKTTLKERINTIIGTWPLPSQARTQAIRQAVSEHFEDSQQNWDDLYNVEEHIRLRQAIIDYVTQ
jgi:Plant transposon protein